MANTNSDDQNKPLENLPTTRKIQQHPLTTTRADASLSSVPSSPVSANSPPPRMSSSSISASSSSVKTKRTKNIRLSKMYSFVGETYRDIRKFIPGICNEMNNTSLMEIVNKYRKGIYDIYNEALEYLEISQMLSKNISQTLEIVKELSTTCINLEEYYHRICELVAIFVSCELRVSMDSNDDDLVAQRIVYTMRKYLIQEDDKETTLYNILRTLVYIPRFFSARNIMCEVFEGLIPLKTCTEVTPLPDKLYMLYIIVFYRWMKMQKYEHDQQLIRKFAESFMKPMVSLCTNPLYGQHLPRYNRHSEATRTILNDMKFYKDLKNACIIDNAYRITDTIVNLCDDDDVVILDDSAEILSFSELFDAVILNMEKTPSYCVKREEKTIVDSVDLTVDEVEDVREVVIRALRERHDKWLDNPVLLAKKYWESMKRLEQQNEKPTNVICLDTDTEDEDQSQSRLPHNNSKRPTNNAPHQTIERDELFSDSYPNTVTLIDYPAEEISRNVQATEDDDDAPKSVSRFSPTKLRTYCTAKKSSSSSTSSVESYNVNHSYKQHEFESSTVANKNTTLLPRQITYRRNTFHITPSVSFQEHGADKSSIDDFNLNLHFSPQCTSKSKGPGVPYAEVNSTYGRGGNVIFSQAVPSRELFEHSDDEESGLEESRSTSKKSVQSSKRVHFDSSPMGPTSAYSKLRVSNMKNSAQHNFKSSDIENSFDPVTGEFSRFRCAPSMVGSTDGLSTTTTKQRGHNKLMLDDNAIGKLTVSNGKQMHNLNDTNSPNAIILTESSDISLHNCNIIQPHTTTALKLFCPNSNKDSNTKTEFIKYAAQNNNSVSTNEYTCKILPNTSQYGNKIAKRGSRSVLGKNEKPIGGGGSDSVEGGVKYKLDLSAGSDNIGEINECNKGVLKERISVAKIVVDFETDNLAHIRKSLTNAIDCPTSVKVDAATLTKLSAFTDPNFKRVSEQQSSNGLAKDNVILDTKSRKVDSTYFFEKLDSSEQNEVETIDKILNIYLKDNDTSNSSDDNSIDMNDLSETVGNLKPKGMQTADTNSKIISKDNKKLMENTSNCTNDNSVILKASANKNDHCAKQTANVTNEDRKIRSKKYVPSKILDSSPISKEINSEAIHILDGESSTTAKNVNITSKDGNVELATRNVEKEKGPPDISDKGIDEQKVEKVGKCLNLKVENQLSKQITSNSSNYNSVAIKGPDNKNNYKSEDECSRTNTTNIASSPKIRNSSILPKKLRIKRRRQRLSKSSEHIANGETARNEKVSFPLVQKETVLADEISNINSKENKALKGSISNSCDGNTSSIKDSANNNDNISGEEYTKDGEIKIASSCKIMRPSNTHDLTTDENISKRGIQKDKIVERLNIHIHTGVNDEMGTENLEKGNVSETVILNETDRSKQREFNVVDKVSNINLEEAKHPTDNCLNSYKSENEYTEDREIKVTSIRNTRRSSILSKGLISKKLRERKTNTNTITSTAGLSMNKKLTMKETENSEAVILDLNKGNEEDVNRGNSDNEEEGSTRKKIKNFEKKKIENNPSNINSKETSTASSSISSNESISINTKGNLSKQSRMQETEMYERNSSYNTRNSKRLLLSKHDHIKEFTQNQNKMTVEPNETAPCITLNDPHKPHNSVCNDTKRKLPSIPVLDKTFSNKKLKLLASENSEKSLHLNVDNSASYKVCNHTKEYIQSCTTDTQTPEFQNSVITADLNAKSEISNSNIDSIATNGRTRTTRLISTTQKYISNKISDKSLLVSRKVNTLNGDNGCYNTITNTDSQLPKASESLNSENILDTIANENKNIKNTRQSSNTPKEFTNEEQIEAPFVSVSMKSTSETNNISSCPVVEDEKTEIIISPEIHNSVSQRISSIGEGFCLNAIENSKVNEIPKYHNNDEEDLAKSKLFSVTNKNSPTATPQWSNLTVETKIQRTDEEKHEAAFDNATSSLTSTPQPEISNMTQMSNITFGTDLQIQNSTCTTESNVNHSEISKPCQTLHNAVCSASLPILQQDILNKDQIPLSTNQISPKALEPNVVYSEVLERNTTHDKTQIGCIRSKRMSASNTRSKSTTNKIQKAGILQISKNAIIDFATLPLSNNNYYIVGSNNNPEGSENNKETLNKIKNIENTTDPNDGYKESRKTCKANKMSFSPTVEVCTKKKLSEIKNMSQETVNYTVPILTGHESCDIGGSDVVTKEPQPTTMTETMDVSTILNNIEPFNPTPECEVDDLGNNHVLIRDSSNNSQSSTQDHLQTLVNELICNITAESNASKSCAEEQVSPSLLLNIDDDAGGCQKNLLPEHTPTMEMPCSSKNSTMILRRRNSAIIAPMQVVRPQVKVDNIDEPIPTMPETELYSNTSKLFHFHRFINYLLSQRKALDIINRSHEAGVYYVDGHAFDEERETILTYYNIISSPERRLIWKKLLGRKVNIFNEKKQEWTALPPSINGQFEILSYVLSKLQLEYQSENVKYRLNCACNDLIRSVSATSSSTEIFIGPELNLPMISDIADIADPGDQQVNSDNICSLGLNAHISSQSESCNDSRNDDTMTDDQNSIYIDPKLLPPLTQPPATNCSNAEIEDNTTTRNSTMYNQVVEPSMNDEQFYSPTATSPQHEVVFNAKGVEIHEMPSHFDQNNILISITNESNDDTSRPQTSGNNYDTDFPKLCYDESSLEGNPDSQVLYETPNNNHSQEVQTNSRNSSQTVEFAELEKSIQIQENELLPNNFSMTTEQSCEATTLNVKEKGITRESDNCQDKPNDGVASEKEECSQPHIAAAATLFRNVFSRPRNKRLMSYSGNYPSMLSQNITLSPKHNKQVFCSRFNEEQLKMSILKRNRLKQRRSTICGRSDFDNYSAKYDNYNWEGDPCSGGVTDHSDDVASGSDSISHNVYQDEKLSKRCAVVIEPTEELVQYERERDAMYNEILQKQRRKLELRAIEKMKEKERRRQEKEQKREQFLLKQNETMKQLERMNLCSKSDEDETSEQRQTSGPSEIMTRERNQKELQYPLEPCVTSENTLVNNVILKCSGTELLEQGKKLSNPQSQLDNGLNHELHEKLQYTDLNSSQTHKNHSEASVNVANTSSDGIPIKKSTNTPPIHHTRKANNNSNSNSDDIESSEVDQIPLLQRMVRSKKSAQNVDSDIKTRTQSTRIKRQKILKSSPSPISPSRITHDCKQQNVTKVQSIKTRLYLSNANEDHINKAQSTDSEFELHKPKQRRISVKSSSKSKSKDNERCTDSEIELDRRPESISSGDLKEQSGSDGTINTRMLPPLFYDEEQPKKLKDEQEEDGRIKGNALEKRQSRPRRKSIFARTSNKTKDNDLTTDSEIDMELCSDLGSRQSLRISDQKKKNKTRFSSKRKMNEQSENELKPEDININSSTPDRLTKMNLSTLNEGKSNQFDVKLKKNILLSKPSMTPKRASSQPKQRRRSISAPSAAKLKNSDLTTTSDMELEQRCVSKKFQCNKLTSCVTAQSDSELYKSNHHITNMSQPVSIKNMFEKNDKSRENNIKTQNVIEAPIIENELMLNDSEKNAVAVIAMRLSSPDSTLVDKQIEMSEHEEILDTLEDMLLKETSRSGSQTVGICNEVNMDCPKTLPNVDIHTTQTTNPTTPLKLPASDIETMTQLKLPTALESDLDMHSVIENIVINEIQREMDSGKHTNTNNYMNAADTESELAILKHTKDTIIQPAHANRMVINFEDEVLQDMLGNPTVNTPIKSPPTQSPLPLVISHGESVSNLDEENEDSHQKLTANCTNNRKRHEKEILITENILLSKGHSLDTQKMSQDVNTGTLVSTLNKSSALHVEASDISPTFIASPCLNDVTKFDNSIIPAVSIPLNELEQSGSNIMSTNNTQLPFINDSTCKRETQLELPPSSNDALEKVIDQTSSLTKFSKLKALKKCYVRIEKLNMTHYTKNGKKNVQTQLSNDSANGEDRFIGVKSPADSPELNVVMENHCTSSISECIETDKEHSKNQIAKMLKRETDHPISPAKASKPSCLTTKTKSKITKTVTFNLVAEIIPISPIKRNCSPCSIDDREQTPPNDYYWNDEPEEDDNESDDDRIYNYYNPTNMISSATRKHYNEDFSNNFSANRSSSDNEEELNANRERDIQKYLNESGDSATESNCPYENFVEEVVVETSKHPLPPAAYSEEPTMNALLPHLRCDDFITIGATDSVPVYLFSEEVVDIEPTDSVLVSSTNVTHKSGNIDNSVGSKKSLMSPSEQEVSSTQETFFQPNKSKSVLSTTVQTADNNTSSDVLQNNQVDTTNNLPEICLPTTVNRNMSSYEEMSQSKVELRHNRMEMDKKLPSDVKNLENDTKKNATLEDNVKDDGYGRNSPPTSTFKEDTVTVRGNLKEKKCKILELSGTKITNPISRKNPFVVRSKTENPNKTETGLENPPESMHSKEDPETMSNSNNRTQLKQKIETKSTKSEISRKQKSIKKTKYIEDVSCTKLKSEKKLQCNSKTDSQNSENSTSNNCRNKLQGEPCVLTPDNSTNKCSDEIQKEKCTISNSSQPTKSNVECEKTKSEKKVQHKGHGNIHKSSSHHEKIEKSADKIKGTEKLEVTNKSQSSYLPKNPGKSSTNKMQERGKPDVSIKSGNSLPQDNPEKSTTTKSEIKTQDSKGKTSTNCCAQKNLEESLKSKLENNIQDKEMPSTAKSQMLAGVKRENSSSINIETNEKRFKTTEISRELKKNIDAEIFTMATELEIPIKSNDETSISKTSKHQNKRVSSVDQLETNNLRQLTTTGIKSAVSHSGRKYSSPKNNTALKRNSSAIITNTSKTATTEKITKNASNEVTITSKESNNINSSTSGAGTNPTFVQSIPTTAKTNHKQTSPASPTSAASLDTANHVRKRQRIV